MPSYTQVTKEKTTYTIGGVNVTDYGFYSKELTSYNQSNKEHTSYIYNLNGIFLDDTIYTLDDLTMRLHGFTTSTPPSSIGSKNKTAYQETPGGV
jgi:hypothetical protein